MSQFNAEHQAAFGSDAPKGGYPDDGNGYYSQKLSYADWYIFNNWQRAHMNFLETFTAVAVMTLITAINQPLWGLISIWTLVVGRIFYGFGYCQKGPGGRLLGALITDIALLAVMIGGFVSVF